MTLLLGIVCLKQRQLIDAGPVFCIKHINDALMSFYADKR